MPANESHNDDYYGFLNVSKTATAEEIRNAYKSLSKRFHPDKHSRDETLKAAAESMFNRLKKIYDVLSEPSKRAIYDTLGAAGVEGQGSSEIGAWTLAQRHFKSSSEIRKEWEAFQRLKAAQVLNVLSNARGNISVLIDATDVFEHKKKVHGVEVRSMSISQSIETPLSKSNSLILSGDLSVRNGIGGGTVSAALRRILSPNSWCETEIAVGEGPILSGKYFHSLSDNLHFSTQAFAHITPSGVRPGAIFMLTRQINKNLVGYTSLKAVAGNPCLSTVLLYETEKYRLNGSVSLDAEGTYLSTSYTHKVPSYSALLKVGVKVALSGAVELEYGCEGKVSSNCFAGAAMSVGSQSGVALRLQLTRHQQSFILPLVLSKSIRETSLFYGSTMPILFFYLVKKYLFPLVKKESKSEVKRAESPLEQALLYRRLMEKSYRALLDRQLSSANGLVVESAVYGPSESFIRLTSDSTALPQTIEECFNVIVPVQLMLNEGTGSIVFSDANKSHLPGFYDCAIGKAKQLFIRYSHRNRKYQVLLGQTEAALLPSQAHLIH